MVDKDAYKDNHHLIIIVAFVNHVHLIHLILEQSML